MIQSRYFTWNTKIIISKFLCLGEHVQCADFEMHCRVCQK